MAAGQSKEQSRPDQTRPDQTRPGQSRAEQSRAEQSRPQHSTVPDWHSPAASDAAVVRRHRTARRVRRRQHEPDLDRHLAPAGAAAAAAAAAPYPAAVPAKRAASSTTALLEAASAHMHSAWERPPSITSLPLIDRSQLPGMTPAAAADDRGCTWATTLRSPTGLKPSPMLPASLSSWPCVSAQMRSVTSRSPKKPRRRSSSGDPTDDPGSAAPRSRAARAVARPAGDRYAAHRLPPLGGVTAAQRGARCRCAPRRRRPRAGCCGRPQRGVEAHRRFAVKAVEGSVSAVASPAAAPAAAAAAAAAAVSAILGAHRIGKVKVGSRRSLGLPNVGGGGGAHVCGGHVAVARQARSMT